MGEVYRAKDTKLGREVALKVLPDTFTHDPERLARFRREAQVLAALNHPHIAQIHGLEEANGTQFLVLELVDGESLDKRIARGPIPIEEALAIATQIAEALEAAHDKGIVHRDLKPANIALTSNGQVKVLDFGLAKAVEVTGTSVDAMNSPTITSPAMVTQVGVILGTAAYMAPEQAKGRAADTRSDVWAFGCVLYEMLTGRRAFEGDDVGETLAAVIRGELNQSEWPRDLPPLIATLVRRALEKDRSRRIADFSTVSFLLSEASTPSEVSQRAAPAATARVRRRARDVGIAVATALIVAFLTIVALRSLRPATPAAIVTHLDLVTPSTSDPFSFALSPDSRQLTFVATLDGISHLWVRSFDSGNVRPLVGTEGASYPFWKPDGTAIGFFAQDKLKIVDATGGALPRALTNVPGARGGTWNQDDVIVFAPQQSGLMRIGANGGTPELLTHLAAGQGSHRWPQFLPDGRRLLFLSALGQSGTHGVYLGSLDGREPTRLLAGEDAAVYTPPGYLLRVIDGVLVAHRFNPESGVVNPESVTLTQPVGTDDGTFHSAFSVSPTALAHRAGGNARRQLVWLDRKGNVTGTVGPPDNALLTSPELAPHGRPRILVGRTVQGNTDIYIDENRFTFDPTMEQEAIWSPDASRIVFTTDRNGNWDLFERIASGAEGEKPLLVTPQDKTPCDWSPDGRFLLYASSDRTSRSELWALPMIGDGKPFSVVRANGDERQGQFSPDGRWVAYVSNEGGIDQIYIQPFPGTGGKQQASTNGGVDPRWRRDGRELFYVAPDGKLMAVAIHVEPDGGLDHAPPVALFPTRLATGAGVTIGFRSKAQYAVAPDGRFLMNVTVDDNAVSPISIVLNWQAALPARERR